MGLSEEHHKQLVQYVKEQLDKVPFPFKGFATSKIRESVASPPAEVSFVLNYTAREILESLRTAVEKDEI
jgi:hypothetical protein